MSTLDPLYWTGTQFSILHMILFRRAWRGLHFYLGWGYNHKVPIWIMLRRARKKVEIYFFYIFDLIYFYKVCKNWFTFWWEWKTCYYLATLRSWILFIWFIFKTQWDSFYAVDKHLYIYIYIHFWVLWCGWQTELATLTADFYHFLVSRQVIFQYIQCNLDLVTLLVSAKTVTKSHKMEKWSL